MSDLFGTIMTLCFVSCYLPQIIKMIHFKKSDDVSVTTYIMASIGNVFAILYAFSLPSTAIWLAVESMVCLGMTIAVVKLWFKYKVK